MTATLRSYLQSYIRTYFTNAAEAASTSNYEYRPKPTQCDKCQKISHKAFHYRVRAILEEKTTGGTTNAVRNILLSALAKKISALACLQSVAWVSKGLQSYDAFNYSRTGQTLLKVCQF